MDCFLEFYNKLNSAQKEAVDFIDGPMLVLAGPGTGKTELLGVRAANIIRKKKAGPENLLILTYTNAAAKAMKQRLVKMLGRNGYNVEAGTFHSFANSVILASDEAVNYIQDRIQITDFEKVRLMEYILDNTDGIDAIRPFKAPYVYRSQIDKRISELKKEGITPKEFEAYVSKLKADDVYLEEKHIPRLKALAVCYKLYEEYKAGKNKSILDERGRYDFDDMIISAIDAINNEPDLKQAMLKQYTYIMADEFQDTNGAQFNLLLSLTQGKHPNLCCVGDDDQSIFRFQGASLGNFKLLMQYFPGLKTISLKENYRSTKEIIAASDKLIKGLPESERMSIKNLISKKDYADKSIEFREFSTEAEELLFITGYVEELKGRIASSKGLSEDERAYPYNNIAILVRKREDILKVIDAFLTAGIPYATDGKEDISQEKRVRQMLDIIDLADASSMDDLVSKDMVLYSVLTSDYFGIPLSDTLELIRWVKSKRCSRENPCYDMTLLQEFVKAYDFKGAEGPFFKKDTARFDINNCLKLKNPDALARAAWAIERFIENARTGPVHTALLKYIDDAVIYKFILNSYSDKGVLRVRHLRALGSFINMVKETDLSSPAISLRDFVSQIKTRKEHNMPLQGSLVTMSQNGVRILTAHSSKGLEFHTVIIPFCLQDKNWPVRQKAEMIPMPPEIFKTKERAQSRLMLRNLNLYDETRLFYVASTRAKSSLLYTSSPAEGKLSSSYISFIGLESRCYESQADEEAILSKSLAITLEEDSFKGTEHVLKDLVSGLALNPTSLNNYISCKRRFLYNDILRLPSQKKLGLTFGNCVHKALEKTYAYFMQNRNFPDFDFFKTAFLDELKFQGVEKQMETACRRQADVLAKWFSREKSCPVMPTGLENKLTIMLSGDLVFTGKYDKTEPVEGDSMQVRVVDYKTGKPDDHIKRILSGVRDLSSPECDGYLRQIVAYKMLYDNDKKSNRGKRVSQGRLVFIEPAKTSVKKYSLKKDEFINLDIHVTEDMTAELESVIDNCWKGIKSLEFDKLIEYNEAVDKCGGCDYKNICW